MRRSRLVAGCGCVAALSAVAGAAGAQTDAFWVSPVSGVWSDASNWSTDPEFPNNAGPDTFNAFVSVAGPSYIVMLDLDVTVVDATFDSANATIELGDFELTLTNDGRVEQAVVSGGTGTLSKLDVSGTLSLSDGRLEKIPAVESKGTLVFEGAVCDDVCDTPIEHTGPTVLWSGSGDILFEGAASLTTAPSTVFTITNDQTLMGVPMLRSARDARGVTTPLVDNRGRIEKTAGMGQTFFDGVTLDSQGTVRVEAGEFRTNGVDVNANMFTLAGGVWEVLNGSTLTLDGQTVLFNEAEVLLSGPGSSFPAIDTLTQNLGTLTVRNGRNFQTDADFLNTGQLNVGAGTTFRVRSGSSLVNSVPLTPTARRLEQGVFRVAGTLRYDDALIAQLAADLSLIGSASTVQDQAGNDAFGGAGLTILGPTGRLGVLNGRIFSPAGDLTIVDFGTLEVGAGSRVTIQPPTTFTNASGGTLSEATLVVGGMFEFDGVPITTLDASVTLQGAGMVQNLAGQDALSVLGVIGPSGELILEAGALRVLAVPLVVEAGGLLEVRSTMSAMTALVALSDLVIQPGATLRLGDGFINAKGPVIVDGLLEGRGMIDGEVLLNGELAPDGSLIIGGDLLIGQESVFSLDVPGDFVQIQGALAPKDGASPNGTVIVNPSADAVFVPGQEFEVIGYGQSLTAIADFQGLKISPELRFEPLKTPSGITLRVVENGSCRGDFDGNGSVDGADFGVFGSAFGSMKGGPNYLPAADFDGNGVVDGADFGEFGAEFGRTDCFDRR